MRKTSTTSAFTLIELLVVIAILALLVSILMPSLAKARDAAKTVVCATNLKAIGTTLASYTNEYNGSYPGCDFYYYYDPKTVGAYAYPFILNRQYLNLFSQVHGLSKETFYCPLAPEGSYFSYADDKWVWKGDGRYGLVSYSIFPNIRPYNVATDLAGNIPTSIETASPAWVVGADGLYEYPTAYFRMTHEDGNLPKGGNILYVDNHVDWKHWADYNLDVYIEPSDARPRIYAW